VQSNSAITTMVTASPVALFTVVILQYEGKNSLARQQNLLMLTAIGYSFFQSLLLLVRYPFFESFCYWFLEGHDGFHQPSA